MLPKSVFGGAYDWTSAALVLLWDVLTGFMKGEASLGCELNGTLVTYKIHRVFVNVGFKLAHFRVFGNLWREDRLWVRSRRGVDWGTFFSLDLRIGG